MTNKYYTYEVADVEVCFEDGTRVIFDSTNSVKIKDNRLTFTNVLVEENLDLLIKGSNYDLKVTTPLANTSTNEVGIKHLNAYYYNAQFEGITEATFECDNTEGFTYQFDIHFAGFEMKIVDVEK